LQRAELGSALILDPGPLPRRDLDRLIRAIRIHGVRLLLYTDGSDEAVERIIAVVRETDCDILIRGAPDERFVLRRILDRRLFMRAPAALLARLSDPFARLRPRQEHERCPFLPGRGCRTMRRLS
jgi:hypothetical protein